MFFRPFIKLFRVFSQRKCMLTKRARNPSTFQECMDVPEQSSGRWKTIFFILLLLPTIYYVFHFKGKTDSGMEKSNNNLSELANAFRFRTQNESSGPYYYPPGVSARLAEFNLSGDILVRKQHEDNGQDWLLATQKPTKPRKIMKSFFDFDGLPLCAAVTVNDTQNTTDTLQSNVSYVSTNNEQLAVDFGIGLGGHYAPKGCRPRHKVAILVPYWWNRKQSLKMFLYYIHPFLIRQQLEYRIFVVEQNRREVFNKGRLFNAGFLEIQKNENWQCVIFHDVDLLPADNRIRYTCPILPRHMCADVVGKENVLKYHTVFGGVTAMTIWHYKKANGYSNLYWGVGESEDMFKRLQAAGLGVTRYKKDVAKYISLNHVFRPNNPKRYELLVTAKDRYKKEGLNTLTYHVVSYASYDLYTHIVVNVNVKDIPDYITEESIILSP